MTLQLLHSIFPYMYMWKIWFSLLPDIYLLYATSALISLFVCYFLSDIYLLSATFCLISFYCLLLPAWYLPVICYGTFWLISLSFLIISAYCMPLSLYLPGNWQCHARISAYYLLRISFLSFLSSLICLLWHVAVFRRKTRHGDCNRGTAGFAYVGGACVVNKRLEKVKHCKKC